MSLAPLAHVLFTRVMKYDASRPTGPIGTGSCSRSVTPQFCSTPCCTSPGSASRSTTSRTSVSGGRRHRPPRSRAHRRCRGHDRSARPGRGQCGGYGDRRVAVAHPVGADLFDHHVFAIAGDGCLSEGISHEAASLAGHLGLGKLVMIYDDNHITIDGETDLALSDDAAARFRSYGWHVLELGEVGEDLDALEAGLNEAKAVTGRPRSSSSARSSEPRRPSLPTPTRHTVTPSSTRRSPPPKQRWACPSTRPSTCPPTCSRRTGPPASAAAPSARRGSSAFRCSTVTELRSRPNFPVPACPAGTKTCPSTRPATASPPERPRVQRPSHARTRAGPHRRRRRPHR